MHRRFRVFGLCAAVSFVVGCDGGPASEGGTDGAGSTGANTSGTGSTGSGPNPTTDGDTTEAPPNGDTGEEPGSTSGDSTTGDEGSSDESTGAEVPAGEPMWMVVGNWGYRSWTSDGVTWETESNPAQGNDHTPDLLRGVGWGNGYFVAVGGDQNAMVMRSADGTNWEIDLHPDGSQWKGGVAYGDGRWVAVGGVGTVISSDDDALTWVDHEERLPAAGRFITHANGVFVAIGDDGMIAVSEDGESWTDRTQPGTQGGSAAFAHGVWAVAGRRWNGGGFDASCLLSVDTETWTPCPFGGEPVRTFASDDRLFVVRADGYAVTADGQTWEESEVSIPAHLARGGEIWVGADGDRRYHGASVDALENAEDGERGIRAFTMGYVE